MASAGLKRPSDFDLEYPSQHTSPGSSSTANKCQWSANKRRCTVFASQSMMASPVQQLANTNPIYAVNIHAQSHNVSNQQCTQQLPQQHQQHHYQGQTSTSASPNLASSPFKDPMLVLGHFCEDVTSMIKNEVQRAHHHHQQQQPNAPHQHSNQQQSSHHAQQQQHQQQHNQLSSSLAINYDAPTLSVRQTQAICERIIREREQRLREEYDKILVSKLAEQYDTFVKYTHDNIERRYNDTNSHQSSYLS